MPELNTPDPAADGYCIHSPRPGSFQPPALSGADPFRSSAQAATAVGYPVAFFFTTSRWSTTATQGATGSAGDPILLTFSFPNDGVTVPAASGLGSETASPNILHATLDTQFKSREIWEEQFRRIFVRWSLLAGIQYTQSTDDSAAYSASPGVLGSRGDVRVAGHHIDGSGGSNVLAYSFFPDTADLVVDTDNTWSNDLNGYRFLRNVLGHEQGHGLGLTHPAARSDTQWLMEPVISTAFDGPQEDDIRGVQRLYGDNCENNDTSATATDLGTLGPSEGGTLLLNLSTDHLADIDWYKFTLSSSDSVAITVNPVGTTYTLQAEGLPVQGTVDAKAVADLRFVLFQSNATTVIADVNSTTAGNAETVTAALTGGQTYFVKVFDQSGADDVQRYELTVAPISNPLIPPRAVPPLNRDTATGRVYVTAREAYDPDHADDVNNGIVKVEWDMDNNGVYESLGADASWVYGTPGAKLARMRVTDSDGLTTVANFTVQVAGATETKAITITAPASGAIIVGTSQTITWTTSSAIPAGNNVKIEVSRDAGFIWTILSAATPNSGSFTWASVTGPASNSVLFRVSDATDPAIFDASHSLLSIASTPTIQLTAPVGGESFNLGYPVAITWNSSGVSSPILIELSRDGGGTFSTLAAAAPNTGSFSWTATAPTGAANRIRVSDSSNGAITDTGGNFTLAPTPTLTLTAPVGGETFVQGTNTSITWTSTGTVTGVKIEFSPDSGATWQVLAANAPATGSFAWTVTQAPTTQGRIRVSDAAAPAVVNDASPADFTIPIQTLTVLTPNGGQTYRQGDNRTITWATSGVIAQVDLEVSTDNGATWSVLGSALPNTGSFAWFITQPVTVQALIRVKDSSQPVLVRDTSDAVFTILNGVGFGTITVLFPNGGETLPASSLQTIRWSTTGFVQNVKIEVTVNGGAAWQVLTASTPNTGSFTWTTPGFFYTRLLIRITDVAAPAVTDSSNAPFQIGLRPRKKAKGCALVAATADFGPAVPPVEFILFLAVLTGSLAMLRRNRQRAC
ncbi:MAG TPA: matrixin family metalloprotease [Planctomycetota bacterium]|nr:matrixin family metalloprotease [Planctomycetota bacterium]